METERQLADLIVANGDVFTGDRGRPRLNPGAIAIRDGRIAAIGPEAEVLATFDSANRIDAGGALVHPGFIEPHLHLTSIALHGFPLNFSGRDENDLPTYSEIKTQTDDEATAAFAAAAAVALLRKGYTVLVEPGTVFETDAFAESLTACGIRGLVSAPFAWDDVSQFEKYEPGFISDTLMARAPAKIERIFDDLARELQRNDDAEALVTGYVCIYGEGTATDELLTEGLRLARERRVLYNQHQGFLPFWYDVEVQKYGRSGIVRLEELGGLGPQTLLTHLNVADKDDIAIVERAGPGVVWCPNNAMAFGVFPAHRCPHPRLYKAGLNVPLGTDVTLSHSIGTGGLVSLLVAASIGEPLHQSDPFYMQTIDAARGLMLGDTLGSLTEGKAADVVVRSVGDIIDTPLDDMGAVLALDSSMIPVDTVIVAGQIVMADGRLTRIDQDTVLASARFHRNRIIEKAMHSRA